MKDPKTFAELQQQCAEILNENKRLHKYVDWLGTALRKKHAQNYSLIKRNRNLVFYNRAYLLLDVIMILYILFTQVVVRL